MILEHLALSESKKKYKRRGKKYSICQKDTGGKPKELTMPKMNNLSKNK